MGPAAVRTAPAGVRNRAGPRTGAGKRVAAAVAAGRRARGPGRAQMAAAVVGSGLGRKRAASVLVSCFCKANLDYREREREIEMDRVSNTREAHPLPGPHPGAFLPQGHDFGSSKSNRLLPTPERPFQRACYATCLPAQQMDNFRTGRARTLGGGGRDSP